MDRNIIIANCNSNINRIQKITASFLLQSLIISDTLLLFSTICLFVSINSSNFIKKILIQPFKKTNTAGLTVI